MRLSTASICPRSGHLVAGFPAQGRAGRSWTAGDLRRSHRRSRMTSYSTFGASRACLSKGIKDQLLEACSRHDFSRASVSDCNGMMQMVGFLCALARCERPPSDMEPWPPCSATSACSAGPPSASSRPPSDVPTWHHGLRAAPPQPAQRAAGPPLCSSTVPSDVTPGPPRRSTISSSRPPSGARASVQRHLALQPAPRAAGTPASVQCHLILHSSAWDT